MKVGELFVNIGIKGGADSKKDLNGVKGALGEVKSMSLEAKAAILGAIYALERMMSQSAKAGTDLMNFGSLTGLSSEQLQRWQYAAQQAGVQGEELAGSVKSVQSNIANMLMGKGGIEGYAMVANKVGLDETKLQDTFYVMNKLQEFSKSVPADIGNQMLRSFGLSDGVIAAMRRNSFRPDVMSKAPVYSVGEQENLTRINAQWANLGQRIQMAIGHLTARHGMTIIKDITQLVNVLMKLADVIVTVAEKFKVLQVIGKVFEGWGLIFQTIGDVMAKMTGAEGGMKDMKALKKDPISMISDYIGEKIDDYQYLNEPRNIGGTQKQQTINVNQNLNFQHSGKDAKKTGDSTHKAVKDAFRSMSLQGQGN